MSTITQKSIVVDTFNANMGDTYVTLVYAGQTVNAVRGGIEKTATFEAEGYGEEYALSVWAEYDLFTEKLPKAGELLTVDGTNRLILGSKPDALNALVRIDLGGEHARA